MSILNFLKDTYQTEDSFDFNQIPKINPKWIIHIIGILDFSVKSLKFAKDVNIIFMADFLNALAENPYMQLEALDLSNNDLSDKLLISLVDLLLNNRVFINLKSLKLYGNKIGDIGAKALSTYLVNNSTLISLNLNNNMIGNSGIIAINLALEKNHTLEDLYLSNNKYDSHGAKTFGNLISRNKNITILSISFTNSYASSAYNFVDNNTGVSSISDASDVDIVTNSIANAISKNNTIKKFILNKIILLNFLKVFMLRSKTLPAAICSDQLLRFKCGF